MNTALQDRQFGPWNPGLRSQLPRDLWPLSTLFRRENAFTGADEARELAAFTGLSMLDHAVFRPERLALHELLVRITADLSVPDGPKYEDLGINFRAMTSAIFDGYVAPHMNEIVAVYDAVRQGATAIAGAALGEILQPAPVAEPSRAPRSGLARLFRFARPRPPQPAASDQAAAATLDDALAALSRRAAAEGDPLERATCEALHRLCIALRNTHGALIGDQALIVRLAADLVCNEHGSELIGRMIEPWIAEAAAGLGYRTLPAQDRPVVMNVKGASASGKSTTRPLQRRLAGKLGIDWRDFALISPDIWRKYLLDYDSLGPAAKYAGMLTGHELAMIDHKLDRYMSLKAERGTMPHLLIDRFRFDSFAIAPEEEAGSRLLTRFGATVYMFFMITPPDATVERAWKRGLQFGRYKAVDDLLDHNIEAFTGMPHLFFTWALRSDKQVHYEFLDNSVAEGELPRTVAFGLNGDMTILDVKCLLDVDRYTKINVDAKRAEDVYPGDTAMRPENNTAFLRDCVQQIPTVRFADRTSRRIYARLENGRPVWIDPDALAEALQDPDTRAGLAALDPVLATPGAPGVPTGKGMVLDPDSTDTLGRWGPDRACGVRNRV